jgi:hypothetical protein
LGGENRKGAKAQRRKDTKRIFVLAIERIGEVIQQNFAPLRLCAFAPLRLCAFAVSG